MGEEIEVGLEEMEQCCLAIGRSSSASRWTRATVMGVAPATAADLTIPCSD
jgi:hypothetical protein